MENFHIRHILFTPSGVGSALRKSQIVFANPHKKGHILAQRFQAQCCVWLVLNGSSSA